jgi:hypothetical protein
MSGPPDGLPVAGTCPLPGAIDADARERVRQRLVDGVGRATADLRPGDLIEVTLAAVRRAHTCPGTVGLAEPDFAWKPVFARRSLGLAAVRACADGRFRAPAAAVGPLADSSVDEWRRTGRRTFHWEPWFTGLGSGGRAAVLAEATTWASPLWAAYDWSELGWHSVVGGADDLWRCPGPGTVRLKGRCEVRISQGAGGRGTDESERQSGTTDLVSVSSGSPSDGWREELGFLALVAGLSTSERPVPSRVTGMWPDAGVRRTVEVDEALLARAADRVVATVALTTAARFVSAGATASTSGSSD